MTTPNPGQPAAASDVAYAQILMKLGEISTQVAVVTEQLKAIPDHETRLRALERFRFTMVGVAVTVSGLVSAAVTWLGIVTHH